MDMDPKLSNPNPRPRTPDPKPQTPGPPPKTDKKKNSTPNHEPQNQKTQIETMNPEPQTALLRQVDGVLNSISVTQSSKMSLIIGSEVNPTPSTPKISTLRHESWI